MRNNLDSNSYLLFVHTVDDICFLVHLEQFVIYPPFEEFFSQLRSTSSSASENVHDSAQYIRADRFVDLEFGATSCKSLSELCLDLRVYSCPALL